MFAKLLRETISVAMSVCLTALIKTTPILKDFLEIWYLRIFFLKPASRKFKFH